MKRHRSIEEGQRIWFATSVRDGSGIDTLESQSKVGILQAALVSFLDLLMANQKTPTLVGKDLSRSVNPSQNHFPGPAQKRAPLSILHSNRADKQYY